ncbi:MAG: hypothetical protein ACREQD_05470, partial [Candidatus Binataceae bacterium]
YQILERLRIKIGGFKQLADARGRMGWPTRGVYLFFERGEVREDGRTPRVVRVGTHAVSRGSQAELWGRLLQHRGPLRGRYPGGGNHRGSQFRYLVGDALIRSSDSVAMPALSQSWGIGNSASREILRAEHTLEVAVSDRIRPMPFLYIAIDDPSGPESMRKVVERSTIALLSNLRREQIDPPSKSWLGLNSYELKVRESGLWNIDHVDEDCSPDFLVQLWRCVDALP